MHLTSPNHSIATSMLLATKAVLLMEFDGENAVRPAASGIHLRRSCGPMSKAWHNESKLEKTYVCCMYKYVYIYIYIIIYIYKLYIYTVYNVDTYRDLQCIIGYSFFYSM